LSPWICCSIIFGVIALIPCSCAPNFTVASKIFVYLDVWDPLVLSRQEKFVSPFDNSERRFGWHRPMVFLLELSLQVQNICVHMCWFATKDLTYKIWSTWSDIGFTSVLQSA
jgi:hypothetical protein